MKKIILILFFLFACCMLVNAEEAVTVYRNNEEVFLSHEVINYNDQYYISLEDLPLLGLTVKEHNWTYTIGAADSLGLYSYLTITPSTGILVQPGSPNPGIIVKPLAEQATEADVPTKIETVICSGNFQRRVTSFVGQSTVHGTDIPANGGSFSIEQEAMIRVDGAYYISCKFMGLRLCYQYSVTEGRIDFQIADRRCVRLDTTIYLSDGILAPKGGHPVSVSVAYKTGEGDSPENFTTLESVSCVIPENEDSIRCFFEIPAEKITDSKLYFIANLGDRYALVCNEYDLFKVGSVIVYGKLTNITYTLNVTLPEADEIDVPFTVHVTAGKDTFSGQGVIPKGEQSATLNVEGLPVTKKYSTRIEFGYHKYKNAYLEEINFYQARDFSTDYIAEYSNAINCTVSLPEGYIPENDVTVTVRLSEYLPAGAVVTKDRFLNWEDSKTVVLNQENSSVQIVLYTQTVSMLSYTVQDVPEDLCRTGYYSFNGKTESDRDHAGKIDGNLTVELKLLREKTVTATLARPFSLPDDTDIYGTVILYSVSPQEKYILNQTDIPLIPAGEYLTKVSFRMPEDKLFYLYITDIHGDDYVFERCSYSYGPSVSFQEDFLRPILYSSGKIEVVLPRCNIVTGRVESEIPNLSYTVSATCYLYNGTKISVLTPADNGVFSLQIPDETDYYVLDVRTNVGVESYYISDGISTYEQENATKIDYKHNDDKQVVIQYFVQNSALPIKLTKNSRGNGFELENISDYPFDGDVYVVYYNRDGGMNSVEKIEDIVLQGGANTIQSISVNDYRSPTVKVFAWKNDSLVPQSNVIEFSINREPLPKQDLSVFTAGDTNAVINCQNQVLSAAPREIDGTLYLSAVDFERLGYQITQKEDYVYIADDVRIYQFEIGAYETESEEENIHYSLYAPILQEENEILIPVTVVSELFGVNTSWYSTEHMVMLNNPFSDVEYASVYREAILSMYYNGIIIGYEDGTFHPNETVMRCETARIFCRAMGWEYPGYVFSCSDVPMDHWAKGYIGICVNEGIFQLKNNYFRPEEYITVEEAVGAVLNMVGEPYENSIETAKEIGLMAHISEENISRSITRAELMQLLYLAKIV